MKKIIYFLSFILVVFGVYAGLITDNMQVESINFPAGEEGSINNNLTINSNLTVTKRLTVNEHIHIHDGEPADTDLSGTALHVYSNDDTSYDPDGNIMLGASVIVDGPTTVDKNIVIAEEGDPKWAWQTYRNEAAKYFYLYNIPNNAEPLVISDSGRVGVNKRSNISDYHTYTASGTDELSIDGIYTGNRQRIYKFNVIATNAAGDSYSISNSFDNIAFTSLSESNLMVNTYSNMSTTGLSVKFGSTNGHELTDEWYAMATPQIPNGSMTVAPNKINEFLTTTNLVNPVFVDKSFEISSKEFGCTKLLELGTNSAFYIGLQVPIQDVYFNLQTNGVGCNMKYEYWNGAAWTLLTTRINDETMNLTKSGDITINCIGWSKTNLTVGDYVDEYYWLRGYSTNAVTVSPYAKTVVPHGTRRFAVYGAHADFDPALSVNANGNITIGDYELTESTIQSFYWKFLVSSPNLYTQAIADGVATKVTWSNEMSDAYSKYDITTSDWSPETTNLCRLYIQAHINDLDSGQSWSTYLYENGVNFATIYIYLSRDNNDSPFLNATYVFQPSNITNKYSIYMLQTGAIRYLINGSRENRWYGEKLN